MNEHSIPYQIERQKSFDFAILKKTLTRWDENRKMLWLAELIVDDVSPINDDGLDYIQRRQNDQRKKLLSLLSNDGYIDERYDRDDVTYGLSQAMDLVPEASVEQKALVTLLQAYRVAKGIAPRRTEVYDPRGLAFRILNPLSLRRQREES